MADWHEFAWQEDNIQRQHLVGTSLLSPLYCIGASQITNVLCRLPPDLAQELPHITTRDLAAVYGRPFRQKVEWFHRQTDRMRVGARRHVVSTSTYSFYCTQVPLSVGHQRLILTRENALTETFIRFQEMDACTHTYDLKWLRVPGSHA